jgi:hypothetical protein
MKGLLIPEATCRTQGRPYLTRLHNIRSLSPSRRMTIDDLSLEGERAILKKEIPNAPKVIPRRPLV